MATAALLGYGTLLKRGDGGGPEVFTTLAEVTDIAGVGAERPLVEVTSHDSPNAYREYILGLKDGKEFTATLNFVPSNATQAPATGVIYDVENSLTKNYKMVFPTSPSVTASMALLARAWEVMPPIDKQMQLKVTFKVTGTITWS